MLNICLIWHRDSWSMWAVYLNMANPRISAILLALKTKKGYDCGNQCKKSVGTKLSYIKEWESFFWVHWEWIGARDKQIAWTAKRFSDNLFVPRYDSFPMNPEKDTHSLYLQCFQQGLFLKFSDKRNKFEIPTATGLCINQCTGDLPNCRNYLMTLIIGNCIGKF